MSDYICPQCLAKVDERHECADERDERECAKCGDSVLILSSRDWCDGCEAECEPATDMREELANVLRDENGLQPTPAALDVIMAVVRETVHTDEKHGTLMAHRSRDEMGPPLPTLARYAIDAERALRILRKYQ